MSDDGKNAVWHPNSYASSSKYNEPSYRLVKPVKSANLTSSVAIAANNEKVTYSDSEVGVGTTSQPNSDNTTRLLTINQYNGNGSVIVTLESSDNNQSYVVDDDNIDSLFGLHYFHQEGPTSDEAQHLIETSSSTAVTRGLLDFINPFKPIHIGKLYNIHTARFEPKFVRDFLFAIYFFCHVTKN